MTKNSGVIEEICMSSAKDHNFDMSVDMIKESSYLKEGDFLLEDRGFIDIDLFKFLNKKGIYVIIPAKKNMEIYKEAIEQSKQKNSWKKLNYRRKTWTIYS